MHGFLWLRCLLKDVWVCDPKFLFSCSGAAVPPSGKGRRAQWGTIGDGVDPGQDGRAGKLLCSENRFPLLFATDN